MGKSAIRELFYGKNVTSNYIKMSQECREAGKKLDRIIDAFLEQLTPEQRKMFNEAYELITDDNECNATDHFVEGFKSGLLIGIEAGESRNSY